MQFNVIAKLLMCVVKVDAWMRAVRGCGDHMSTAIDWCVHR